MSESVEVTDRPENSAQLADLIESLTVYDRDRGAFAYQQAADAMWKAPLAAFNYVARKIGATGFQASWAALRFYGEAMHVDGPFMIVQLHEALYPQYDVPGQVARFIEENRDWLREQAQAKLAEYDAHRESSPGERPLAHPNVVAHWRKLAES